MTVSKPAVGLSPPPSWSGIIEKTLRRCGNIAALVITTGAGSLGTTRFFTARAGQLRRLAAG